MLLVLWT
ncbi:hypothetical protein RDI58_029899 [Solanum bulbocastanum]